MAGPLIALAVATALTAAATATAPATSARCVPVPPTPGAGVVDPFRPPDAKATLLNAAAKTLYRQGQWEAARTEYRAAVAADPDFLAPRLNIACSFVRQERFAEATAETIALVDRAYVPWAREVLEAADLGALKVHPEIQRIDAALAAAAAKWGAGLEEALIFVARQRAPLRVPSTGQGVFILNPHQEVYAFLPATNRFRQLTAEDGHVVAAARSTDGRRVTYVVAEQLIRGPGPSDLSLARVAIGELTLATMAAAPLIAVEGQVRRIDLTSRGDGFAYRIDSDRMHGWFRIASGGALVAAPDARAGAASVALTARGTEPAARPIGGTCAGQARDRVRDSGMGSTPRAIGLVVRSRPPRIIGGAFGAGLTGLPLP